MKNAKSNHKLTLIGTLMILSELLICGFAVYWLTEQYNEEEKVLMKELSQDFKDSQKLVLDSLLLDKIIHPVMSDSLKLTVNYSINDNDKGIKDSFHIREFHFTDSCVSDPEKMIALKIKKDSFTNIKNNDTLRFLTMTQKDMLMRSVELIVTGSGHVKKDSPEVSFTESLDSVMFKEVFTEDLNSKGMSFDLQWISDEDDSVDIEFSGIYINSDFPGDLPAVNIDKYRTYLLGLILPQILFSLLLAGLTASAFFFTYKNLKKQILLNKIRNEFINNMTHELKTPVSTILIALDEMKNSEPETSENNYLNAAKDEAQRLNMLISKLIDQTKLDSKKYILKKEKILLIDLVSGIKKRLDQKAKESNTSIESDIPETTEIFADHEYMFGVIYNILDNAIKYSGKNAHITITGEQDDKNVRLTIKDNGPGIPEEFIPKLFEAFFRVPKGDVHNVKGYGLGLSYAALVMKEHKGKIEVKNNPKGGCSFILSLPKYEL